MHINGLLGRRASPINIPLKIEKDAQDEMSEESKSGCAET